jgi:hypothetical protein
VGLGRAGFSPGDPPAGVDGALRAASWAGGGPRTVALLLRLPWPLFRLVAGREWFREVGRPTGGVLLDDVLASLR